MSNNEIVKQELNDNALAVLPVYNASEKLDEVKTDYCGFIKESPDKFNIPDIGEVPLSEVTFRLLHLNETFTKYNPATEKYEITDGLEDSVETHVCVVVIEYKSQYWVKTFNTRRSLTQFTAKLHNLNLDTSAKIKNEAVKERPYYVARAKVGLKMRKAQSGFSYQVVSSFEPQEMDEKELEAFVAFMNRPAFATEIQACMSKNQSFLDGE